MTVEVWIVNDKHQYIEVSCGENKINPLKYQVVMRKKAFCRSFRVDEKRKTLYAKVSSWMRKTFILQWLHTYCNNRYDFCWTKKLWAKSSASSVAQCRNWARHQEKTIGVDTAHSAHSSTMDTCPEFDNWEHQFCTEKENPTGQMTSWCIFFLDGKLVPTLTTSTTE